MKHRRSFLRTHPVLAVALAVGVLVGSGALAATAVGRPEPRAVAVPAAQRPDNSGLGTAGATPAPTKSAAPSPRGKTQEGTRCGLSAKLVPSCGLLWGVAPGAFTDLPSSTALGNFERTTGRPADPAQKAWIYSTVRQQLGRFPAIKALVYFDSPNAPKGDTRPDSSQAALSEFQKLASSTVFSVTL